jgi:uncharacterized membrane protein
MNPWNVRNALLAKHAQHVVLIHFPIALFLTGVLFDLVASVMPNAGNPESIETSGQVWIPKKVGSPAAWPGAIFVGVRRFGFCLRRSDLAMVSFWNLTLAAISALPAALTGVLAWQWELDGRRLKGILLLHLISGTASLLLIAGVWFLHERARRNAIHPPAFRWALEILAVAVVAFTGHLGGFLTGVNHL